MYAAPTSGGKTLVAVLLMLRRISELVPYSGGGEGFGRALYVLPLRATVSEKVGELTKLLRPYNESIRENHDLTATQKRALSITVRNMTVEQGYEAAKMVGLNLIASMKSNLGSLDKVKRVVKLTGWVNSTDGFTQQPQVVNGCSELFRKVFDEKQSGHTRSAVGTNGLPLGVPVEIEAIVEIKKD